MDNNHLFSVIVHPFFLNHHPPTHNKKKINYEVKER